ncbi:MAG TPA: HAD family hydrolase [Acidimicrobiales bacterium]
MGIEVVGVDGDDTLWHNEGYFALSEEMFCSLLAPYVDGGVDLDAALVENERRNLELFGYGIKGFMLSMVETAIEVTEGRVPAVVIQALLDRGKEMLRHPVELLDGVAETIEALHGRYTLVLVTKGDLMHQEQKVARSGLAERFDFVEIVSEKDEATYERILRDVGVAPAQFVMVGNSVRSDILPVLAIGGRAVHVPYHLTWDLELAHHDGSVPTLDSFADLPAWLAAQP